MVDSYVQMLHDIESALAEPRIGGVPIGSTLADAVVIQWVNRDGVPGLGQRWRDRLRWLRYRLRARRRRPGASAGQHRILVTWRTEDPRFADLVLPVVRALGPGRCTVLYDHAGVLPLVPPEAEALGWSEAIPHQPAAWSAAFRQCWPAWKSALKAVCRKHGLPPWMERRLGLRIFDHSQLALGCREFLSRCRPAAVVTEFDRASLWSCLVLAARSLAIPSFTLQHGVPDEAALGYVPVLADRMFCWGEVHREALVAAGQDPASLIVGGCSRLTRDLSVAPAAARARLGLPADRPVALLGTSPVSAADRRKLAEIFCRAAQRLPGVSAVVRLHPSERLATYADLVRRYPQVRFTLNSAATLDEALAAADVVVVHNSGLGSDALVKRRPVVVVEIPGSQLGHGRELRQAAGCPCVAGPEDLAVWLGRLFTESVRQGQLALAEGYVKRFCAAFGADSAACIAGVILAESARRETPLTNPGHPFQGAPSCPRA